MTRTRTQATAKLRVHPLSMEAALARQTAPESPEVKAAKAVKPMGGSRRKRIYRRQSGSATMTPAQSRRYRHKVRRNGYIPK